MSLFEVLKSAEITDEKDLENHKETLKKIFEKPYAIPLYCENVEGKKFNLKKLRKKDLIVAMETASYIGVSAKRLLDHYLWKLSAKAFRKIFTVGENMCEPKDTIPQIVKMELLITYGKPRYFSAKLSYKDSSADEAAARGNLKLLKKLLVKQKKRDETLAEVASLYGHLDCLKFLCEKAGYKLPSTEDAGNLECLKYLRKNGADWNECTISRAVARGDLESIKYAHENGCEWDSCVLIDAAKYGRLDCLKYAHENGCEWDEEQEESIWAQAVYGGHMDCLEYIWKIPSRSPCLP